MTDTQNILVVDDQEELADNMAEVLEAAGFDAQIAHSAEEALEKARSASFDGVIVDYRLPGRSGVDLIRGLRALGSTAPVLMVSGYADEDVVDRAENAGALDVLSKPVDVQQLLKMVELFRRNARQVLVVEDNSELAENLVDALQAAGFDADVGKSAEAALAKRNLPRVALVDMRLPDGSGTEVAKKLCARDPSIRILVMTAYGKELEDSVKLAFEGERCFDEPILEKPLDTELLVARVSKATNQ